MGLYNFIGEAETDLPSFNQSTVSNIANLITGLKSEIPVLNFRRPLCNGMEELEAYPTQIPPSLDHYVWQLLIAQEALSSTHEREHAIEPVYAREI